MRRYPHSRPYQPWDHRMAGPRFGQAPGTVSGEVAFAGGLGPVVPFLAGLGLGWFLWAPKRRF